MARITKPRTRPQIKHKCCPHCTKTGGVPHLIAKIGRCFNVPECCILSFVMFPKAREATLAMRPRVISERKLHAIGYIPCPACIVSRRFVTMRDCRKEDGFCACLGETARSVARKTEATARK